MQLQNIYNTKRFITLFTRDNSGELTINKDNSFHPYYYELDEREGIYNTYDGFTIANCALIIRIKNSLTYVNRRSNRESPPPLQSN